MERTSIKTAKIILKTTVLTLLLVMGSLLFFSYKAEKLYADLWQQLGLTKETGTTKIRESFLYGYLQYYGARNIKNIAKGDRAAVAKELLAYTRKYVESEAFKKEYTVYRNQSRPQPPRAPKTEDEIRKEMVDDTKKSIEKTEATLKTIQPDLKKIFEDNLELQKKRLKEFQDPNNKPIKIMAKGEQQNFEYGTKEYNARMKEWEEKKPENPLGFVKGRLQEMLDATKEVDFDAELTEKYGKKVFVNATYERKNSNWKYAFRAGKEVTETVRSFAQQWISEIK